MKEGFLILTVIIASFSYIGGYFSGEDIKEQELIQCRIALAQMVDPIDPCNPLNQ